MLLSLAESKPYGVLSEHMLLVAVGCRTLHRLSSLELLGDCFRPAELEQLMHHVSALTRLTQLRVSIHDVDADVIETLGLQGVSIWRL